MDKLNKSQLDDNNSFSVIDDGNFRGVIAPSSRLSSERLAMLVEDLEDTDPEFLAEVRAEYEEALENNDLISSDEIKREFGIS